MNLLELSERAARDCGFTVKFKDETTPTHGFAVSLPGYERKLAGLHPVHLGQYLVDLLPVWEDLRQGEHGDELCLGAWLDGNTWYLDLSIVVPSESYARELGKRYNQLAIFNLAKKETITL